MAPTSRVVNVPVDPFSHKHLNSDVVPKVQEAFAGRLGERGDLEICGIFQGEYVVKVLVCWKW